VYVEPGFVNGKEITEEKIYNLLASYTRYGQGNYSTALRRAAVLVPMLQVDGEWHLLFTRRTDTVLNHKGQVSFPGGAVEPEDRDLVQAALRETHEEIGLLPDQVKILGRMPDYETISYYLITPVVGRIPWPYKFSLSPEEVMRVFTIPLKWLADDANWEEKPYLRPNGKEEMVIYYETYYGELLWGITARITLNLLHLLGLR
jgi:8-oxo-dGTP pyrophosphatase MutT (NUDIX family)